MNFKKNNLSKATSPYLQQHKNDPIYWQEWSKATLDYAKAENKPILLSVGYATCHWCHVMAHDTFQDKEIADYLNDNFVCVKVDREQRPDIDQYLMEYSLQTKGSGGWPLNVMCTPALKPFAATTYLPATPARGLPSFLQWAQQTKKHYEQYGETIPPFALSYKPDRHYDLKTVIEKIEMQFDKKNGGFGFAPKFPPNSTLLFLQYYYQLSKDEHVRTMIEKTLESMALRGLHDHLQGGFFRYCSDSTWVIPHFEKMLYDQALLLWNYSLAYALFKNPFYKKVVHNIIVCLEETFADNDLFFAAHDADTNGVEGQTYVWDYKELQELLTPQELKQFDQIYQISKEGNFEGENHLLKIEPQFLPSIEKKLLAVRKKRKQPFVDKKIITSWNALTGIGFIFAARYADYTNGIVKAEKIFNGLVNKHMEQDTIYHSSKDGTVDKQAFLEDAASMLLLATYLQEETNKYQDIMNKLNTIVGTFYRNGMWLKTKESDFMSDLPAQPNDLSIPSNSSLAQFGQLRTKILNHKHFEPEEYKQPFSFDFYNLVAFVQNGNFHLIGAPEKINWHALPINVMQTKAQTINDCFKEACREFNNIEELKKNLA